MRRSADVNQTDDLGRTALFWAAFDGRVELLGTLITCGADVNKKDTDGATALTAAVTEPQPEAVRLLLAAGADVHARYGEAAWTPLMGAVWVRCAENVRVLAKGGADLHARDLRGRTCLMIAKEAQYPDMVELLHQLGAKE